MISTDRQNNGTWEYESGGLHITRSILSGVVSLGCHLEMMDSQALHITFIFSNLLYADLINFSLANASQTVLAAFARKIFDITSERGISELEACK